MDRVPEIIRLAMVFATDFSGVSPGGIASVLLGLARHLRKEFRLVMVGVGGTAGFRPEKGYLEGREITRIAVVARRWRPQWLPLNILFLAKLFLARRTVIENADVINPHRAESALPFVLRKKRPVILTIHGSSDHHRMLRSGLLRWRLIRTMYDRMEQYVLGRVDKILLVSGAGYRYYVGRYPWLQAKCAVVPNSVDLKVFSPVDRGLARARYGLGESDLVVVYCGRLSEEKRLDLLLEAFQLVVAEHPTATLLMAGEGPEGRRLRQKAAQLAASKVRFMGLLNHDELPVLLSAADVFVLPSRFEGFPVAVVEALACGVPVVAADAGATRDILANGLERFVLSCVDPRTIKDRILEAASAREQLASLCVERARDFDAARVTSRLEAIYRDVVNSEYAREVRSRQP